MKDRLKASALGLSGGQQQRLCIARALAVQPEVILMDEPCSALDPIATARIEDLMQEIKARYTIVIVTHNMQQAARISDRVGFFTTEVHRDRRSPHRRARRVRAHVEDVLQPRPTRGPRPTSPAASADQRRQRTTLPSPPAGNTLGVVAVGVDAHDVPMTGDADTIALYDRAIDRLVRFHPDVVELAGELDRAT